VIADVIGLDDRQLFITRKASSSRSRVATEASSNSVPHAFTRLARACSRSGFTVALGPCSVLPPPRRKQREFIHQRREQASDTGMYGVAHRSKTLE